MFTQDESNYLRGLLILAGIDRIIAPSEKEFIVSVGMKMGFNREFCSESLDGILQNEYIDQSIPVFSNSMIAESFLIDGYRLAMIDGELCSREIYWLNTAAKKNNVRKIPEKA